MISSLTKEQEDYIGPFCEKWVQEVLTYNVDEVTRKGVIDMYKNMGEEIPVVFIMDGP